MVSLTLGLAVLLYVVAVGLEVAFLGHLDLRIHGWACKAGRAALAVHLLAIVHFAASDGVAVLLSRLVLPTIVSFVLVAGIFLIGRRGRFWVLGSFACAIAYVVLSMTLIALEGGLPEPGEAVGMGLPIVAILHVATVGLGSLAFLVSLVLAALYLEQDARLRSKVVAERGIHLPALVTLETAMYRILAVGFVAYTLGVVLGWTFALGTPEPSLFQPRYTLAILSWLSVALVVGMRFLTGWSGRRAVLLLVFGFLANLSVGMAYYFRGV